MKTKNNNRRPECEQTLDTLLKMSRVRAELFQEGFDKMSHDDNSVLLILNANYQQDTNEHLFESNELLQEQNDLMKERNVLLKEQNEILKKAFVISDRDLYPGALEAIAIQLGFSPSNYSK